MNEVVAADTTNGGRVMVGFICYGIGGLGMFALGNVVCGSIMLTSAAVGLMFRNVGNDD